MKKLIGFFLMLSLIFVIVGCQTTPKTSDLLEQVKKDILIIYQTGDSDTSVTKNLTLITNGKNSSTITWSSSNTEVIANDGTVTRPTFGSGDAQVTLTATIRIGEESLPVTFNLTVKEQLQTNAQKLAEALDDLAITYATGDTATSVTQNITLPTTIGEVQVAWTSSTPTVISNTGEVHRPSYDKANATVILLATLTIGNESDDKSFTLTVPKLEMTDADAVADTKSKIIILNGETTALANFSLPTSSASGATITWTSSDSTVIEIIEEGKTAKVKRPAYGEDDASVTLTATITVNEANDTRTFTISVPALTTPPATIESFKMTAKAGDEFTLTATVIGIHVADTYKGYYIWDGTETLYVHNGSTVPTVQIGDSINITGKYDIYYGMPQLTTPAVEVLSQNNALPTPVLKVFTDFYTAEASVRTPEHSDYVSFEKVLITKESGKYYMTQNGVKYQIFDQTLTEAVLDGFVDKTVNINVIAHSYHSTYKLWQFSFINRTGDIEEVTLTDDEIIQQAVATIEFPADTFQNLELPTLVNGVSIAWVSSHPEIIATNGTVVLPTTNTVVTLTATFTLNDASFEKSYEITVLDHVAYVEVPVANDATDGTELTVEGIVYANSSYGYLIYSGGEFGFVYTNAPGEATVGDHVVLNVTVGSYKNLKQLQSPELVETLSHGNTLPVIPEGTIAELIARTKTAAIITATVSIEGSNNNVFLTDANGDKIQVYYKSTVEYQVTGGEVLKRYEGQVVTLPVVMYQDGSVLFVGDDSVIDDGENKTVADTFYSKDGSKVRVEGIVIANSSYGYVIYSDGEYGFVYTNAVGTAVVGDNVVLDVTMGTYKNLRQLTNPTLVETLSSANPLPVMEIGTIKELADRELTAAIITATVSIEGSNNNVFLTDANGDKIQVYFKSTPEYNTTSGAVLKAFEGKVITLPVVMYQDGLVLFLGTTTDVTEVTGESLIDYVMDQVVLEDTVTDNLTLPTILNGVTISWASDNETVIALDGTITRPAIGQEDEIVTLTATFTVGEDTDTKTFVITVPALVEETTGDFTDLIFSQYIEGGSYNKAIEIYNGTNEAVDLSEYTLVYYNNASATPSTTTLTLSGTLNAGEVYVIANTGANEAIKAEADLLNNFINHNGDDVYVLKHNDTIIDSFGCANGTDPGDGWTANGVSTYDMTLVRKTTVTSGDTVINDAFDPSLEWVAYPKDSTTNLGAYTE